jgi:methylated-DNA-[protein]-cysteine S-methyltransferase
MTMRNLLRDLRQLGSDVQAPPRLLRAVLDDLQLGDEYALLDTLLGPLYVAWNANGISSVMRAPSSEAFEAEFQRLHKRSLRPTREVPCDLPKSFDLRGLTTFEQAVLRKTAEIPIGQVRTYSWVASQIGYPRAVRAVGSALARNPVPVFIPCHRVVRSDGIIGNYGLGGPEAKRSILSAEGLEAEDIQFQIRTLRDAAVAASVQDGGERGSRGA